MSLSSSIAKHLRKDDNLGSGVKESVGGSVDCNINECNDQVSISNKMLRYTQTHIFQETAFNF